jgi:hypothetical protein
MIPGEHYDLTYAPVAGWTSVWLLLALVLLNNWYTVQLDYVLAYPQAPVKRDLYMLLPMGFSIKGMDMWGGQIVEMGHSQISVIFDIRYQN